MAWVAAASTRAQAHDPPAGSGVFFAHGQLVIRTNRGLISDVDGARGDFRLVCNEALRAGEFDVPSVLARADGQLLVGTSQGMLRISPDLCELMALPDFEGTAVWSLVRDAHAGANLYAATDAGLFVSTDDGDSFARLDTRVFDSLAAPSEGAPPMYATGKLASAPGHPRVYFARWQTEQMFEAYEFALAPNEVSIALLGAAPAAPGQLFAVAHAYLGTPYPDRFLVSGDGARTWRSPLSAPSVAAFVVDPKTQAWLVAAADGLWRGSPTDMQPQRLQPTALTCLAAGSGELYVCDGSGAEGGVARSTDGGEHITSILRFAGVAGLPTCAERSPAVEQCQAAWSDWQREIPAGALAHDAHSAQDAHNPELDAGAERSDAAMPRDAAAPGTASARLDAAASDAALAETDQPATTAETDADAAQRPTASLRPPDAALPSRHGAAGDAARSTGTCAAVRGNKQHRPGWPAAWLAGLFWLTARRRRRRSLAQPMLIKLYYLAAALGGLFIAACSAANSSKGSTHQPASADAGALADAAQPARSDVEPAAASMGGQSADAAAAQSGSAGQRTAAARMSTQPAPQPSHGSDAAVSGSDAAQGSEDDAGEAQDDLDGGAAPAGPPRLCASCGGCEQAQKVTRADHTTAPVSYPDPPPTSGPHNPCWASWGIHETAVAPERWVHNLEHGGVVFLYNCPDGCDPEVARLEQLLSARPRTILTAYSALPNRFAVVSWGHRLVAGCLDEQAFAQFYADHYDHAPESIASEPNPSCPP